MTDRSTTTVTGDNLLMSFFSKKGLKVLREQVALYQLAEKEPIPAGSGVSMTFNGFRPLGGASSTLSEYHASANSAVALSSRKVTATLGSYGRWSKMSDYSIKTSVLSIDQGAIEELTRSAKLTMDDICQLAVVKNVLAHVGARSKTKVLSAWMSAVVSAFCSNTGAAPASTTQFGLPVVWGSSATRLSAINASSASLSARTGPVGLRKAVTRLQRLAAMPYDGGSFVAVMHPYAMQSLMANPLYVEHIKSFYEGPKESLFPGEVKHQYNGCRFVVSQNAPYYRKAAAASALSANITIILGRGAFSVSELSGDDMSIIIKRPGANSTNDPFDLMHTASFKLRAVAAVTNPSSGVLLIGVDPGSVTG